MVQKISKKYKNYFDQAFMLEVSEYCWNFYQALCNINQLLKKDGILYLSTHFFYPIHNPEGQDMIRITPDGAEKLLRETGFEILEHKYRYLQSEFDNYWDVMVYEKMRPRKNYDHSIIGSLIKAKKI